MAYENASERSNVNDWRCLWYATDKPPTTQRHMWTFAMFAHVARVFLSNATAVLVFTATLCLSGLNYDILRRQKVPSLGVKRLFNCGVQRLFPICNSDWIFYETKRRFHGKMNNSPSDTAVCITPLILYRGITKQNNDFASSQRIGGSMRNAMLKWW